MLSGLGKDAPWRLPHGSAVAVLGAGLMGHGIAAVFAGAGYRVTCVDPDPEALSSLPRRVATIFDELPEGAMPAHAIVPLDDPRGLAPETALVIEAAPEDLELKRKLLSEVGELCPEAVLATNSSVYRVGDVSELVPERGRVIGTHWWNPPHLIPLVEVVQGSESYPAVIEGALQLLREIGKLPVHVKKDTPGFVANRLQHALWREAMALVQEGVCDAATVDLAIRNSIGLRLSVLGPLENADYVGLDLVREIHSYVFPALCAESTPLAILEDAVAAGHLGAKSGVGFFSWSPGQQEATKRRLAARIRYLISAGDSGKE